MCIRDRSNCIKDVASSYTARQEENINTRACRDIKCAIISAGNLNDGNITVILKDSSNGYPFYCDFVKEEAIKRELNGTFSFSGSHIKF